MGKRDNNISEYVQAYVPDTEELATLLAKAKGDNRSMAEFARACKVKGPSTFSRIVNEKIDKPLSDELLYAIVENAADQQEVTIDKFMRANGKLPKDEMAGGKVPTVDNSKQIFETQAETRRLVKEILLQEFYEKGHTVLLYPDLLMAGKIPLSRHAMKRLSDFALHLQGMEPLYWNFIVDFTDMQHVSLKAKADNTKLLRGSMQRYAQLFLRDAWEPDTMEGFKNTIVFTEEKAFKTFLKMISDVKLNTWMSVMLVDLEKRSLKSEIEIGRRS